MTERPEAQDVRDAGYEGAVARRGPQSFEIKRMIGIFSIYLAGATLAGVLAARHPGVLAVLPLIAVLAALAIEFGSYPEQREPR